MSEPAENINSQSSSTETENTVNRKSFLDEQGFTLGHQVGSGCYAKVKVSFFFLK